MPVLQRKQEIRSELGTGISLTNSPEIKLGTYLYSLPWAGIKAGLVFYVQGQTASDYKIGIDNPINQQTLAGGAEIPLKGLVSGGHEIQLFSGIRWTLGLAERSRSCSDSAFADRKTQISVLSNETCSDRGLQQLPGFSNTICIKEGKTPLTAGSYAGVRETVAGGEVHHMPPVCATKQLKLGKPRNASAGPNRDKRPAILMETADHKKTSSNGSSNSSEKYNDVLTNLVNRCQFDKAQEIDINDLHINVGNGYDVQIGQMKSYTDTLSPTDKEPPLTWPDRKC